jgi:hypothetical protein
MLSAKDIAMKFQRNHAKASKAFAAPVTSSASRRLSVAIGLLAATVGCQGNPLTNLTSAWNQPTRVPPPPTGAFQPTGAYSGNAGLGGNAGAGVAAPPAAGAAAAGMKTSQVNPTGLPYVDSIASAQSQLKAASDSARNSINQTTNSINSQVELASARLDRFGNGVVQASQVLSDAAMDPSPVPPVVPSTSYATSPAGLPGTSGYGAPSTGVGLPSTSGVPVTSGSSGRIGDTVEDPNAQWRKPVPRN